MAPVTWIAVLAVLGALVNLVLLGVLVVLAARFVAAWEGIAEAVRLASQKYVHGDDA